MTKYDTPNWKCPACEGKKYLLVRKDMVVDGKNIIDWVKIPCQTCSETGIIN